MIPECCAILWKPCLSVIFQGQCTHKLLFFLQWSSVWLVSATFFFLQDTHEARILESKGLTAMCDCPQTLCNPFWSCPWQFINLVGLWGLFLVWSAVRVQVQHKDGLFPCDQETAIFLGCGVRVSRKRCCFCFCFCFYQRSPLWSIMRSWMLLRPWVYSCFQSFPSHWHVLPGRGDFNSRTTIILHRSYM